MQTDDDLNIESTSGSTQTEESWYVLTRQMYISAAVSQLNCLMALGMREMKVRPADLLRRLRSLVLCLWQLPPAPSPSMALCPCPVSPVHSAPFRGGSEDWLPKQGPPLQAPGTLTSSSDLQLRLSLLLSFPSCSLTAQTAEQAYVCADRQLYFLLIPSLVQLSSV